MRNNRGVAELVEEAGFLLLDWALHPEVDPGCGLPMDLIFPGLRNGWFAFHFLWSTGVVVRYSGWVVVERIPGLHAVQPRPFKDSPVVKAEM